jgi:hypothetical protein
VSELRIRIASTIASRDRSIVRKLNGYGSGLKINQIPHQIRCSPRNCGVPNQYEHQSAIL